MVHVRGDGAARRPHTLKLNEHVRVDLLYSRVSERTRIWIDILGGLLFLLPICAILVYFTWPLFVEFLAHPRGLIECRRPGALAGQTGAAGGILLMALQGMSEIIKRIAALTDSYRLQYGYEKPLQ